MSFNISGFDSTVFYGVNSALHLLYFVALPLPTIVLCAVGVVALLFAKDIQWKMRVALINVLIPDTISSLAGFFINFGYPIRVFSGWGASCSVALSLFSVGIVGNFLFTPFFSIVVYVSMKYRIKKLKWWAIATFLILAWLALVLPGVLISADPEANLESSSGFCTVDYSLDGTTIALATLVLIILVIIVLGLCIVLVFSILTYCYVKKNSTSTDTDCPSSQEKAVTRVLTFYAVKMVAIVAQYVILNAYVFFSENIEEHAGIIPLLIAEYLVKKLSFGFISFLSPIICFVNLKPLRDALTQIKARCVSCKNLPADADTTNSVHD